MARSSSSEDGRRVRRSRSRSDSRSVRKRSKHRHKKSSRKHRRRSSSSSGGSEALSRSSSHRRGRGPSHRSRSRSRDRGDRGSSEDSSRRHRRNGGGRKRAEKRRHGRRAAARHRSRSSSSVDKSRSKNSSSGGSDSSNDEGPSVMGGKRGYRSSKKGSKESSRSSSIAKSAATSSFDKNDPCAMIPGFLDLSPAEQNQVRMKMALRAAAAADEKLRGPQGSSSAGSGATGQSLSYSDQVKRAQAIDDIEKSGFQPASFTSSRSQRSAAASSVTNHETAMFGAAGTDADLSLDLSKNPLDVKKLTAKQLLHTSFQLTWQDKMPGWLETLGELRKRTGEQ